MADFTGCAAILGPTEPPGNKSQPRTAKTARKIRPPCCGGLPHLPRLSKSRAQSLPPSATHAAFHDSRRSMTHRVPRLCRGRFAEYGRRPAPRVIRFRRAVRPGYPPKSLLTSLRIHYEPPLPIVHPLPPSACCTAAGAIAQGGPCRMITCTQRAAANSPLGPPSFTGPPFNSVFGTNLRAVAP